MASNTRIKDRTGNKTNSEIIETVRSALKNDAWKQIAQIVSSSTKAYSAVNLSRLDKESKAGDTIVIPGKLLSSGNLTKKIKVCALSFSKPAIDKLKVSKSEHSTILAEIKSNPKAQGIKILR